MIAVSVAIEPWRPSTPSHIYRAVHRFHKLHLLEGNKNCPNMECNRSFGVFFCLNLVAFKCRPLSTNVDQCTEPWLRARLYLLWGLPLLDSECICPQCTFSFVIVRESAKPSAIGLPVHLSRANWKYKLKTTRYQHHFHFIPAAALANAFRKRGKRLGMSCAMMSFSSAFQRVREDTTRQLRPDERP